MAINTAPYQFIGYWGYGSERELTALLTNVERKSLNSPGLTQNHQETETEGRAAGYRKGRKVHEGIRVLESSCISPDSPEENYHHPVWNVAYIGLENKSALPPAFPKNIIAAISASGLSTSPDAWVRLQENDYLILGREAFGRVPLYWTQKGQVIWFASQLQLLLPILSQPEVSVPGLYGFSCFSYVPTPFTPVNEVFAVPAGTELVWRCESGRLFSPQSQSIYSWRESAQQLKDEATAVTQLQTLLQDAIGRQIADLKDEPVGVLLSGGLDSSVVAALLVKAGVKVRAYTLDFGEAAIPEYPYAEQVAEFLKIPLVKVVATPGYIKKALIPTVRSLDLPFGDGVTVPLYLLTQAASQETQVIFNGEGGDQLFAGWTNKPLIAAGVYQAENPAGQETFSQQYLRTFHRLWGYESQVFQPEISVQIQNLSPEDWLLTAIEAGDCPSLLHRLRRAGLMLKGAQNIHPRATALGFAHNLWVRSPFCDLPLAEWTFQLSGELLLNGACEKYILKKAVENWLPPEIVWRQKRGMGVPLTSWCLNDFWHQIGIWLNPGVLRANNHFSSHIAAQIITGELGGAIQGRRVGESLWLLIMWQLWHSQVFGAEVGRESWNHPFWLPSWLWKNYKRWQA